MAKRKAKTISVKETGTSVTDDFERADGALGANWSAPAASESPVTIAFGTAKGSAPGVNCLAYWSAGTFQDNQYSEAQLGNVTDSVAVMVRVDNATDRFYMAQVMGGGTWVRILQRDNDWFVLSEANVSLESGDRMKLEVHGTSHPFVLELFKNDESVLSWTSTSTDQEKTGGSPGIGFAGLNASIQSWEGGNLEADGGGNGGNGNGNGAGDHTVAGYSGSPYEGKAPPCLPPPPTPPVVGSDVGITYPTQVFKGDGITPM